MTAVEVLTTHEDVEVLGAALDPGVVAQRVGAADEKGQRASASADMARTYVARDGLIVRCGRVAQCSWACILLRASDRGHS